MVIRNVKSPPTKERVRGYVLGFLGDTGEA